MAIRITSHQVCDRCLKPFAQEYLEYGQVHPVYTRKDLKLLDGDKILLAYQDLCENCDNVVEGLIKKLKLESDPKKPKLENIQPQETHKPQSPGETHE